MAGSSMFCRSARRGLKCGGASRAPSEVTHHPTMRTGHSRSASHDSIRDSIEIG